MKKNWIWLVVIVVVALVALWFWKGDKISQNGLTLTPGDSVVVSPTPKPVVSRTSIPVPGAANYTQLVSEYDGRRLQFNDKCQMTPPTPTFKNGTKIMLDNRSKDSRVVTINDKKYSMIGYGYQLVTLTSTTLPQTLNINCDSMVNAGRILLQATISNQ